MNRFLFLISSLLAPLAVVAQNCSGPGSLSGVVTDQTGAMIRGATVTIKGKSEGAESATSGPNGSWHFDCLKENAYELTINAPGFRQTTTKASLNTTRPVQNIAVTLTLATVEETIAVNDTYGDNDRDPGSTVLNENQLRGMADDPDDFVRELQSLATAGGGAPGKATITVDGFQNASRLPPKSSLQRVTINPDMFSAEYGTPPYAGGRIEAFTKAGQDKFHGAVFGAFGPSSLNARDPLALSSTPASKRRFGFEFNGPLLRNKRADFSLDLEYRHIDENAVVNATTLSTNGTPQPFNQTVPTPERLWIGNGRTGWQIGTKSSLIASFGANTTSIDNKGVGGLVLPEAAYGSTISEYDLRLSDTTFLSPRLLNSVRLGLSWKNSTEAPYSTAPQLAVAGAFVGGGSPNGSSKTRERDLEIDNELLLSLKRHTSKFGVQLLGANFDNTSPQQFNGVFTFGGGVAPDLTASGAPTGATSTISGIEQYRRAVANLPGGNPSTYSITQGSTHVPLVQWTVALYGQDQWQVSSHFSVAAGLRYFAQTAPDIRGTFAPRLGLQTALGKKQAWVFHARAGLFYSSVAPTSSLETVRLDGARQHSITVYSPSFQNPLAAAAASPNIGQIRRFAARLSLSPSLQTQFSVEHTFFKNWSLNANYYYTAHWDVLRSRNVNSPMLSAESSDTFSAPRPFAPNLNIFEYQPSGRLAGPLTFLGVNHFGKRFSLISGYLYNGLRSDGETPDTFPQSSSTNRGDLARPSWLVTHNAFAVIIYSLPFHIASTTNLSLASGMPYDVTTGFDNNGDGVFNDRPALATAPGAGIYPTRFGLLNNNTVNGNLTRNIGTMPATVHLDLSLSREFKMSEKTSAGKHEQTLRIEGRSSNVLNHVNYTNVDGIVGTPQFGLPLTADYGRRIEFGVRLSF